MHRKLRPLGRRIKFPLMRIVGQIKSPRLTHADILLGKTWHHMFDVFADAIVIFNQHIPINGRPLL